MPASAATLSTHATNVPGDETLMEHITHREPAALAMLFGRYKALLSSIIAEPLHDFGEVDEVLSDLFLEVWKNAASFDADKGKPLGWLIRMARCRAIDRYRKRARRAAGEARLEAMVSQTGGSLGEELSGSGAREEGNLAERLDLRGYLLGLVYTLPPAQSEVVYLTYFQEMSQREVSAHLGVPLGTTKTRLSLGLQKLARQAGDLRGDLEALGALNYCGPRPVAALPS